MLVQDYNRLLARAVLVPLGLLGVVSLGLGLAVRVLLGSADQAQRTEEVIGRIANVGKLTLDLESGLRGYLATGDVVFLEPYRSAEPQVDDAIATLWAALTGDAQGQQLLGELSTELATWRGHEGRVLNGDLKVAPERLARELEGKRLMDAVRVTLATLNEHELAALAQQRARESMLTARAGPLGLAAVLVVALVLGLAVRRPMRALVRSYAEALAQVTAQAAALRRRERELDEQRDRIVDLQSKKEQLVGFMVHDLRSPLAVIRADVGFVLDQPELEPETREAAAAVAEATERILRLCLDMLDVMGGGATLPVRATSFGMRDLIADVTRGYERRAHERGLRISVGGIAGDLPCQGDPQLIRRMLENFVENALKYTPRGGEVCVELTSTSAEHQVVRVRDTGPGIPSGARDRVFDAGFRLGRDANAHRTSRGLGLAFCRVAAEAQGGRVWVEDGGLRGSAFCIELPSTPPGGTPALPRAA